MIPIDNSPTLVRIQATNQRLHQRTINKGKELAMLVLTRRLGEAIVIGDDIVIKIVDIHGKQIRIGVEAPPEISVHRRELYQPVFDANKASVNPSPESVSGFRPLPTTIIGQFELSSCSIEFPIGLIGYSNLQKFTFSSLQSEVYILEEPEKEVKFCLVTAMTADKNYSPKLTKRDLDDLETASLKDLIVLTIVSFQEPNRPTANLAAPILINFKKGIGKQVVIMDNRYSATSPIPPESLV